MFTKSLVILGWIALWTVTLPAEYPIFPEVGGRNLTKETWMALGPGPIGTEKIDSSTIAEYEKRGSFFGGFIGREFQRLDFEQGEQPAKDGIPGFCWYTLETEDQLSDLPRIKIPFGIEIRSQRLTDAGVNKLTDLKNLKALTLYSNQLTDSSFQKLATFKNLEALSLWSQNLNDKHVKNLISLKNLTRQSRNRQGLRQRRPFIQWCYHTTREMNRGRRVDEPSL